MDPNDSSGGQESAVWVQTADIARPPHQPDELLLGFAAALRSAGVPVTPDRSRAWLQAASLVGLEDRDRTYWAGRATLCSCPDDLVRYEQVFDAWFLAREGLPRTRPRVQSSELTAPLPDDEAHSDGSAGEDRLRALASSAEVLRHRDIAEVGGAQKALLAAMFGSIRPVLPRRRAHRRTPSHRGEVDGARTLRATLRQMGEPGEIAWRRRRTRPRRVVLLVDVSGSMSRYADALVRLAHRFVVTGVGSGARGEVEVFTTGTRLTRITRALGHRDPERALVAAGESVPDWAGGTRLGENLKAFLDRWGQRGLARGAVVVVFSDGWERGDPALLAEQMARLHRMAHRVVWVNPHRGKAGYQPVQSGVLAALPYVDDFLAGHSLATFAELTEVIARA